MAKKNEKKVEVIEDMDIIRKVMAEQATETTVDFNGLKFQLKAHIGLNEIMEMVNNIADNSFVGENREYHPELTEFFARLEYALRYTDLKLSADYLECYDVLMHSGLWDCIAEAACVNFHDYEYTDILLYSKQKIEHMLHDRYAEVEKKMHEVMIVLGEITSSMSGVDAEDIKNVFGALINGNIDEGKLMEAYMKNKPQNG